MAKPGDPHEVMSIFLGKKLRELYPEGNFSFGKRVKDIRLKPDIFIEFLDGKRWAFEVVHGNRKAYKLQKNHEIYQKANITDNWILWDDLRPKIGKPISNNQGIFATALSDTANYQLNAPQTTLLNFFPKNPKYLYCFSIDPFRLNAETPSSNFLNTMMMGIIYYEFQGNIINEWFELKSGFLPITELDLTEFGRIKIPEFDPSNDEILINLKLNPTNYILKDIVLYLLNLISTKDGQSKILAEYLKKYINEFSDKEKEELARFIHTGGISKIKPFQGKFSDSSIPYRVDNLDFFASVVEDQIKLKDYIDKSQFPVVWKKLLLRIFFDQKEILMSVYKIMDLQQSNPNYQDLINK